MSINFYLNTKDGELHIGKRSIGWYFILHIYPEKNINELIDWVSEFKNGNIFDEYGHQITANEMIEIIINDKIYGKKIDESNFPKYGSSTTEIDCIYGENGLKRISEQKEGAMGLYSLETREFS